MAKKRGKVWLADNQKKLEQTDLACSLGEEEIFLAMMDTRAQENVARILKENDILSEKGLSQRPI